MRMMRVAIGAALAGLAGGGFIVNAATGGKGGTVPLMLSSSAFNDGALIPVRYTCDGENVPPPLQWDGKPARAQSLVLILDDPDAPGGVFTHWVVYEVPITQADVGHLSDGMGYSGRNDFGKVGYGGPCPPRGHGAHRYDFSLSALDIASLGLPRGATRQQVEAKMRGHVVATARLMGKYQRK